MGNATKYLTSQESLDISLSEKGVGGTSKHVLDLPLP